MNTKQTKPTPGPWLVSSSVLVCNSEAKIIAQCANFSGLGVEINEAIANARLIASAPDLLEVLENLLSGCCYDPESCGQELTDRLALYDKAKAIVAKAKGPL